MSEGSVTIARRFRGPLSSANGGYAAGLIWAVIDCPGAQQVWIVTRSSAG
jgi:hypothetical protein